MQHVNLVQVIGHLIEEQKPDLATSWFTSVPACGELSLYQQIVVINRYWRSQLGILAIDTSSLRKLLDDHVEPGDWLENFKKYLLPFIIDHNLPNVTLFTQH